MLCSFGNINKNVKTRLFMLKSPLSILKIYSSIPLINDYIITNDDIIKVIGKIKSSKGSGIDFLPTFILKDVFVCIITQVTYMIKDRQL